MRRGMGGGGVKPMFRVFLNEIESASSTRIQPSEQLQSEANFAAVALA